MIKYEKHSIEGICIKELEKNLRRQSRGRMPAVVRSNLARRTVLDALNDGQLMSGMDFQKKANELVEAYF